MTILKQSIYVSHIIKTLLIISNDNYIIRHNYPILALIIFYYITIIFQRLCHFFSKRFLKQVPVIRTTD